MPARQVFLAVAVVLGAAAPAAAGSAVKDDETVVLYPSSAWRDGDAWRVPIHGWIGELEPDSRWRRALVSVLLAQIGEEPDAAGAAILRARTAWFLADGERGKRLEVAVGGAAITLAPSGKDGHFRGEIRLPAASVVGARLATGVIARDGRRFAGAVDLVEPDGLAVISDVDDTIKISEVRDRRRLLANTFLRDFVAVPGMAARYAGWARDGAAFFYVSGSPWQLHEPLREFIAAAGLPAGELVLREFRVKDDRRWNLFAAPDRHKLAAIRDLLARFPRRRFILVGDAAERDPEIYGTIAREAPGRVDRILIRRLAGDGMTPARWRRALGGCPATELDAAASAIR